MPDTAGADPFGWAIALLDGAFMGLYAQACRNARRASRLVITFLPLMMLLVGSCKTQESGIGTIIAGIDELRSALFPDRIATREESYRPAEGFVVRARGFVQEDPAALSQMTEQEISYIFGAPAFQRRDADARVWQYKSNSCVVDFYFYDDPAQRNESRVAYVDFRLEDELVPGSAPRSAPVPPDSQSSCLRRIAAL